MLWGLVSPAQAQSFVDVSAASGADLGGNKQAGVSWGDLNDDGCLDIVANTLTSGIYSQMLFQDSNGGMCAGTFTNVTASHAQVFDDESRPRPALIGDFNDDGHNDVAIAHWFKLSIFLNQGPAATPAFSFGVGAAQTPNQEFTTWEGGDPVATINLGGASPADFDADGDLDLIIETDQMGIRLLENNGVGVFTEVAVSLTGFPGNDGVAPRTGDYATAGDLDNDGNPDLVVRRDGLSALSKIDLFWNNGASDDWFTPSTEINEVPNVNLGGSVPLCDFNGDGLLDVFWTPAEIYTQGATRTFSKAMLAGVSTDITGATCADLDNDGDIDLFLCGSTDSEHLFLNDGVGTLTELVGAGGIDLGGAAPSCIAADYDRDGSLDLLVHRSGGNRLYKGAAPAATASDYLVVTPTRATGKLSEGATIRLASCDGTPFGPRQIVAQGSARGAMAHTGALFGLGADNANDAVVAVVTFTGGTTVTKAVVPSALGIYQEVLVGQGDADDTSACGSDMADLSIAIDDTIDPVTVGSDTSFTVTVSNAGPDGATNTALTLSMPAGLTLVSTSGCTEDPNGVPLCTLGTIASGAMAVVTLTATANTAGLQTVGASAASDVMDIDGASDTEDTTVVCDNNDDGTTADAGCGELRSLENLWRGGGGCAVRPYAHDNGPWLVGLVMASLLRRRRLR